MSKYADIEQIKKTIREEWIKYMPSALDMNISFVLGKIAEVPTIDIVHCKDCKNCRYEFIDENMPLYIYCDIWRDETDFDGFCKYGEERDEE